MAFVNALITDDDRKRYGLDQIDESLVGRAPEPQWTIDRDRGIYLRNIKRGREEARGHSTWHFYWRGDLMQVCLNVRDVGSDGTRGGHGWVHYQLLNCFNRGFFIPSHLLARRDEIVADLTAALVAYGGGGVYSTNASVDVKLTV